jgi:phosphoesterase RecJ-like protein
MGPAADLVSRAQKTVLIDHHPAREAYTDLTFCDPDAAATGLLIWEMLPDLGLKRTFEVACCCYTALISDTGSFRFKNTDARALEGASAMVAAGADPFTIASALFSNKPLAVLQLDELILSRVSVMNDGAVVVSHYGTDDLERLDVELGWTEDLIDLIRVVEDTMVALLIVETPQGARVSLRSDSDFDVSALAARFGGGGHHAAAGITWPDRSVGRTEILSQLLPLLPQKRGA